MSSQGSISNDSSNNTSNYSDYMYPDMFLNTLVQSGDNWPALNEGEFKTDNFRMYNYKVHPCRRTYVHVWSQCPFYHPGENARRRDPRLCSYSPLQCRTFRMTGTCPRGDECEFAHGLFETWLHPGQYRTKICRDRGRCTRPMCFFAHDHYELRPICTVTGSAERRFPITQLIPSASLTRPSSVMHSPVSSIVDNQIHHFSNMRMLENMFSNSVLGLDDNTPRAIRPGRTSVFELLQRQGSYGTSDSCFSGGPFIDHNLLL